MATQPITPPAVPQAMGARPMPVPNPNAPKPMGAPRAAGAPGAALGKPGQPLPAGVAAGAAALPPEEEVVPLGFFQLPWVQNILPFVTSLTLHATIIIIGFIFLKAIQIMKAPPTEEETIIPDSNMVENGPPGGVPNVGLGGDPFKQAMQDKDPNSGTPEGFAEKKGPTVDLQAAGGGSGDSNDAVIGVGPGGGFGRGAGIGAGSGSGHGSGSGDGSGPMAMFGAPGGGGIGPKGPVFGHGGNARQITFVCDASGSMINKMASLKNELGKAVQGLRPIQTFGIIFFQDEKFSSLTPELINATPENKRKAQKYLEDITTTGTTNPIPGIELAFKQHPQLIYLLTDGDFPDNDAVLKRIRDLNKEHKVKINTIAFVSSADTDTAFLDLLKTVAKENGGVFKHVAEDEL